MHPLIPPDYLWLAEGLFTVLVVGLVFALGIGVLLLARPQAMEPISKRLNRWIDTSEKFGKLEQPRYSERLFYRHHRLIGSVAVLGSLFVLWQWLGPAPRASVRVLFSGHGDFDWLAPAIDWLMVGLHVFVLVIGAIIFLRPSALKHFEKAANRWYTVPSVLDMDAVVMPLDKGFALYPRLGGLLLVVGAGGCLITLVPFVLDHLRG
jgi:hypothetical protein